MTMVNRRRVIGVTAFSAVALALAVIAPTALADDAVLPQSDSLPWTDPGHESPLEVLDSQIASEIARRPVRSYCNGDNDWNALGASREFDPGGVGGFVDAGYYYTATRTLVESAMNEQLSPRACWYLWQYAMAPLKPTKCQTFTTQIATNYRTVAYKAKVRQRVKVRVKVKGKSVTRYRWVTRTVTKTKQVPTTTTQQVEGPAAPCYGSTATPTVGWDEYNNYAFALLVLAHESVHLLDLTAGASVDQPFEARAQCIGIQLIPSVATRLGATADDARSIAQYALDRIYPRYEGTPYWSADCRQGGPLDLSPTDGIWP
jgi:hypothetical protein